MLPGYDLLATPGDGNLAWMLIEHLLPTDKKTGFTVGLSVFIPALVFIGSLMVALHVVLGIVASAHSGKVLGEKFHQIWAPLRVVIGFGALVSVTGSGLAGVHLIERMAFQIGTNSADAIAIGAVEHVVRDGHSLTPISAGGRDLAWQIVQSEVCTVVYNQARTRTEIFVRPPPAAVPPALMGEDVVTPPRKSWVPFFGEDTPEETTGTVWDYGTACGSVKFTAPSMETFSSFAAERRVAVGRLIQRVRGLDVGAAVARAFEQAGTSRNFDPANLSSDLDKMEAWRLAGVIAPGLISELHEIGDEFDATVGKSAAASSAAENTEIRQRLVDGVREHGWVLLPSYYRMMAHIAEKTATFGGERGVWIEPNADAWGAFKNEVAVAMEMLRSQNRAESNRLIVSSDDMASVGTEATLLADMINSISHPVLAYMTSYDGWRHDPVGDLINLGNRLSVGGQTAFGVGLAATGTASLMSAASQSPQKIVEFMMVPGWWAIGLAIIGGSVLSYVMPMMPYIYGIFALGAIAMSIIAFAIAGLLWAFVHIRMDGQELVDQVQSIGYKILFSILLHQPIVVLGFLAAHAITVVLLNIFLMTWNFAFLGSQGNSTVGFLGVGIGFGMMIYIQWHIILRLNGLQLELVHRVAAIFGAAIQGWGDTEHGNTVIAGSAGGVASNTNPGKPKPPIGGDPKPSPSGGKGSAGGGVTARR